DVPKIRLLSFNVYFGRKGCRAIGDEIASHSPDVVALQATANRCKRELAARFPDFHVEDDLDFLLFSRFPVLDRLRGPMLPGALPAEWVRYTLDTPLGAVDLFSVHPFSPRAGFEALRGDGLRTELRDQLADPHAPRGRAEVEANTSIREQQLARFTEAAAASKNPVIIAGDTNLPALSRLYARYLDSGEGRWRDGFAQVGLGFGYTFPAQGSRREMPWMRIDRILASPELRFLHFEVGGRTASDHCPVLADVARSGS
ncbi:MAG TPA: endonuclease/exonuclease/phosphatase family protein, partial [Polyangiaceae bacterium]